MPPAYKPFTARGLAALQAEFDELWKVIRPEVVKRVADAAAEGDRSENAEYIYGKKRMREIDARLRYMSSLLENARVIDLQQQPRDIVAFGAVVTYDSADGERTWQIVGEGENDPKQGRISYTSPVARALLGRRIGDEVRIDVASGRVEAEILDIRYPDA